jgi:hypothetical protein
MVYGPYTVLHPRDQDSHPLQGEALAGLLILGPVESCSKSEAKENT